MPNQLADGKDARGEIPTPTGEKAVPASPPLRLSREWLLGFVLLLAVVLTYTPVWQAEFIWDDDTNLTANPCIIGPLGLKEIEAIWTPNNAGYFPLVLTSFWVEHALWGLQPLPYHLVNVALHAACAVLLWRVLLRLQIPGAWLGAALWALHPVQVETVAWITELKNTQSCLFYLLAIRSFLRWCHGDPGGKKEAERNYLLALLFTILAILSKPSAVILPAVLGLLWGWMDGRWRGRHVLKLTEFFLVSAAASFWAIVQQKYHSGAVGTEWPQTWPERFAIAGKAVWFYLGKIIWPHPLIFIYPRWEIDATRAAAYLPLAAVILALSLLWCYRRTGLRPVFFAFAYFAIALFPVLGFFNIYFFRFSFVGDHFQYLASMGPLALAGAGLARLSDLIIPEKPQLRSALGAGILLVLGILSWQRTWAYENVKTLWIDTLAQNRACWMAHDNLGNILTQEGKIDEAIAHYKQALKINPDDEAGHHNFGVALLQKGEVDEAIAQFKKAPQVSPTDEETHNNLGGIFLQKGQLDDAINQYQIALKIKPNYPEAHYNLGLVFFQTGQVDEAMAQYQAALQINPNYAEAHNNLGNILFQKGRVDQAIAEFQKALQTDPASVETHYNLGAALAKAGRVDDAIEQFQEALRLKSDFAPAQESLAKAEAIKGKSSPSR